DQWVTLYHEIAAARLSAPLSRRARKAEANGRLRVLLIAPSIEILGGQAVQAIRLLASLRDEPSIQMEFQPIDPKLVGPFQFIKRIKFVRTVIRSVLYWLQLLWRVPRF